MALSRFQARALSLTLRTPPSFPASHGPPIFSLERLLCSAAATSESPVSSAPSFAAEDYLVSRCGLTRARAAKASKQISHLGSQSKPDAVVAFLGGTLGVPAADIAALVSMYPNILCADVERILVPRSTELSELGLSREEIARLITLAPNSFRCRFLGRNSQFWLKELGSFDKLLQAIRRCSNLLSSNHDKVTAPNVAFLRQCGLNISDIMASNFYASRLFTMSPKFVQEAVERVEDLGFKRGTRMFAHALLVIFLRSKEFVTRRIQLLQKFGFSQDDVLKIVRKAPFLMGLSHQKIQGNMDFLIKNVGLNLSYIAQRPALLTYSVERRLLPRHCLLQVLREKAVLKGEFDYYSTACMSEKNFSQKFVLPYKDIVPGLADVYASTCYGMAADRVTSQEK